MGQEFYNNYASAREVFDRASNSLGEDLSKLCFESSLEKLSLTENTQPAIFTVSMALSRILEENGIQASAFAGLSLGEYSGLSASKAISLEDGVRLVRTRGQLMQDEVAVGKGSLMAVMGLSQLQIEEAISPLQAKGIISCSNINTDNQIVVGGQVELLQEAEAILKEAGARRAIFLNVSAPFHTKMLLGAGKKLRLELENINISTPDKVYYPNVTGELFTSSEDTAADIANLLENQVYSPVLWNKTIKNMISSGIDTFVEVFPGSVAGSLIKKIDKNVEIVSLSNLDMLETFLNNNK
ncbi:MAG: ACP S-malonyltransferase, partial [Proteocatella sp.]